MKLFDTVKLINCNDVAQKLGLKGKRTSPGKGMWCCPFHDDKTPSMACFDRDNRYHCFSCGARGDAADLYAKVLGLPLKEAARKVCEDFGYTTDGFDLNSRMPLCKPKPREWLINRAVRGVREEWHKGAIAMTEAQLEGCVGLLEKIADPDHWLWGCTAQRSSRLQDNINHLKAMEEDDVAALIHGYLHSRKAVKYGEAFPTPTLEKLKEIMTDLARRDASWPRLTEEETQLAIKALDTTENT